MGVAERREREKQKRINEILDAAEEVFFSGDSHDASIDDVASKAELAKGTIYLYFKSKELIYLGIAVRAGRIVKDMMVEVVRQEDTGLSQVNAIMRAYYEFSKKYPNYFRMKSQSDEMTIKALEQYEDEAIAREYHENGSACGRVLQAAVEKGISDGSIRADINPMEATILLWAQANGVIKVLEVKCEHLKEFGIETETLYERYCSWMNRLLST